MRVDYSGDGYDFGHEPAPSLDASKFFHVTEEEIQVAALEIEPPLGEIATTEGIFSIPFITFLVKHINIVLTPAWMTFVEAATIIEGKTSLNITEMIEELTQPEGSEVSKISTEEIPTSIAIVAGKFS